MADSNQRRSAAKARFARNTIPELSPRRKPSFPLWLHEASHQWCKKVRGRKYYFGTDKDAALKEYLRVKDDLEAGRRPPPPGDAMLSVKELCNRFLTFKSSQVKLGELTLTSFANYEASCRRLAEFLGKETAVESLRPDDLLQYRQHLGKAWGPTTIGNEVNRCRVVLRFAFENGLIDRPVRFGEFKRPAKSALRKRRAEVGSRLFEPSELRTILDSADVHLKAMILLGINCGFGNADCGTLPLTALDLKGGWVTFPRPKTGIERRCPLWPEMVEALRQSIAKRKQPADDKHRNLVFITKYGKPWFVDGGLGGPLSAEFRKMLVRLNLYRPRLSFYCLRHCFQTIADEVGDYIATRRIMGHADSSISDHYRERFQDVRLRKVADHVRGWLFGKDGAE